MDKAKSRVLKYNKVLALYLTNEIGLEDFRFYIRAGLKYKKLRNQFEKGRVGNDELMLALNEVNSIRFIESDNEGKRLFKRIKN